MADDSSDLHAIFGGGTVADIILWRKKIKSAISIVGVTLIWFIFKFTEYNFVTVVCNFFMLMMVILSVWSTVGEFIGWQLPDLRTFTIPESTFDELSENMNWLLLKFYDISSGGDLKAFVLVMIFIWLLSVIGNLISSLNGLYIAFLCLLSLPALYERFQEEVHFHASEAIGNLMGQIRNLIPRFISLNMILRGLHI